MSLAADIRRMRNERIHPTAVIGFQPMRSPTFARPVQAWPAPALHESVLVGPYAIIYAGCEVGEGTVICPKAHIREGVRIGRNCVIGADVHIGYDCTIGDNVQIMDRGFITGGTSIGDGSFIAQHVVTANDDKPLGYVWKGILPIAIGRRVTVGANATIRPGLTIGDDAVIAMGALVVRDVPAGATVKGAVAKMTPRPAGDTATAWPDSNAIPTCAGFVPQ